jgi:hypothetical protein
MLFGLKLGQVRRAELTGPGTPPGNRCRPASARGTTAPSVAKRCSWPIHTAAETIRTVGQGFNELDPRSRPASGCQFGIQPIRICRVPSKARRFHQMNQSAAAAWRCERRSCPSHDAVDLADGRRIAAGGNAGIVTIWNPRSDASVTTARVWAGDQLTLLTAGGESAASRMVSVGN